MSNAPQAPSASHALANTQLPAAYRFNVGGFECTVVSDGPLKLGTFTEEMFRGISQERIDAILAANFLDRNDFTVDQNAVVVNTGSKLVLIDTGMGYRKIYGPRTGHLLAPQAHGRRGPPPTSRSGLAKRLGHQSKSGRSLTWLGPETVGGPRLPAHGRWPTRLSEDVATDASGGR